MSKNDWIFVLAVVWVAMMAMLMIPILGCDKRGNVTGRTQDVQAFRIRKCTPVPDYFLVYYIETKSNYLSAGVIVKKSTGQKVGNWFDPKDWGDLPRGDCWGDLPRVCRSKEEACTEDVTYAWEGSGQ